MTSITLSRWLLATHGWHAWHSRYHACQSWLDKRIFPSSCTIWRSAARRADTSDLPGNEPEPTPPPATRGRPHALERVISGMLTRCSPRHQRYSPRLSNSETPGHRASPRITQIPNLNRKHHPPLTTGSMIYCNIQISIGLSVFDILMSFVGMMLVLLSRMNDENEDRSVRLLPTSERHRLEDDLRVYEDYSYNVRQLRSQLVVDLDTENDDNRCVWKTVKDSKVQHNRRTSCQLLFTLTPALTCFLSLNPSHLFGFHNPLAVNTSFRLLSATGSYML